MRPTISLRLAAQRKALESESRWRRLGVVDAREGVVRWREGRRLIAFCDNDYLGLAGHPVLRGAALRAIAEDGVGATAAHLVCGHLKIHQALEEAVADWLGQPRALLFGSGYLANLGVLQGLLRGGDVCVQDKLNHASLIDGARLSGATLRRYRHADVEAAARQLEVDVGATAMLVTDGVFSMDGDLSPLAELAALAQRQNVLLYVDDAHGAGLLGPQGRGSPAACGLTAAELPLQLLTLGKALGSFGGVVAGANELIEGLLQNARSYVFATALPAAVAAAALAAVRLVRGEEGEWRRAELRSRIAQFQRGALQLGLPITASSTAIQPLILGDNAKTVAAAAALEAAGFMVAPIRPPTVPANSARLRITLSAAHSTEHVDRLLEALDRALNNS